MTAEKCKEKKNRTKKKTLVELFPLPSLLRLPELCPSVEKIFYRNSALYYLTQITVIKKIYCRIDTFKHEIAEMLVYR